MGLLKTLLLSPSMGAGRPPLGMDYVFMEGTASPYDIMYDYIGNLIPVSIATSEYGAAILHQAHPVRLSDGTLYMVYRKLLGAKYQIYVKKSVDNGITWTDDTLISDYAGMASYDQSYPSIVVDSSDYLHAVWQGKATGFTTYDQIWYSKYTGSWSSPLRISTATNMNIYPQGDASIAVDSNDYIHVVWPGITTAAFKRRIWHRIYTASWGSIIPVSTLADMDNYHQFTPHIAVDSNDFVHAVWSGFSSVYPAVQQIWYNKYTGSWGTVARINTYDGMGDYGHVTPRISVDSSDNLHTAWRGKATGFTTDDQVWYNKYTDSWAGPIRISTYDGMEDYTQANPSIAVDSSDYLHVLWHGMATDYIDQDKVWHAEYTDAWATPECLQPTGRNKYPIIRWSRWP